MRKFAFAAAATALLSTGLICAGSAHAAAPADFSTCPAVTVNIPRLIVLGQSNTLTHPTVSTACDLSFLSFSLYTPTDSSADFLDWGQDPIVNGDSTNWTIYDFDYTAGVTYHADNSLVEDTQYNDVTMNPVSFLVQDASAVRTQSAVVTAVPHYKLIKQVKIVRYVRWIKVKRHGKIVRIKKIIKRRVVVTKKVLVSVTHTLTVGGVSTRYSPDANYGSGGMLPTSEVVQIQKLVGADWSTVATVRSTAAGGFNQTINWMAPSHYRLVVPGTTAVAPSMSASFTA